MSGDSPNSHRNDIFDFKEGRQSPAPTTSKEVTFQSGNADVVHASVLVEPEKKEEDDKALSSPFLNNLHCDESSANDPDNTVRMDELSYSGRKNNDKDSKKKMNGDKLDGVWVPGQDSKKKPTEEEDDNCTVKCLYYTMQCCECVIV